MGGMDGQALYRGVARLDARSLEWTEVATFGVGRYAQAAAPLGEDRWLVAGGLIQADDERLVEISAAEIVDLRRSSVTAVAPAPFPTAEPLMASLPDGRVILAGGYTESFLRDAAIFDPSSGAWHATAPLPHPCAGTSVVLAPSDRFVVWLGSATRFDATSTVAVAYDATAAVWHELPVTLPFAACLIELDANRVLVSGGYDDHGTPSANQAVLNLLT